LATNVFQLQDLLMQFVGHHFLFGSQDVLPRFLRRRF
jgi:hypothetical protein